ncbi:MAG TPA: cyclodeaminase/cyclohydrolase family protein [Thermoanaerobaculia bacterium]|nr:cyclodeaminase/cyclohydrolase family protein [Thermoanaerobaculia bacterium]
MHSLVSLSVTDFAAALASDAPAPGGGSAAAAAGAAGAGLLSMVVRLTLGKEKYRDAWETLEALLPRLEEARGRLLELVDEDTKAYEAIVGARKLRKESDAEKAARKKAIDDATLVATAVPMQTAFFAEQALRTALTVGERGNPNAASDAFVAALLLAAAVDGALANVRINLGGVADAELKQGFAEDADDLAKKGTAALESCRALARTRGLLA